MYPWEAHMALIHLDNYLWTIFCRVQRREVKCKSLFAAKIYFLAEILHFIFKRKILNNFFLQTKLSPRLWSQTLEFHWLVAHSAHSHRVMKCRNRVQHAIKPEYLQLKYRENPHVQLKMDKNCVKWKSAGIRVHFSYYYPSSSPETHIEQPARTSNRIKKLLWMLERDGYDCYTHVYRYTLRSSYINFTHIRLSVRSSPLCGVR